MHITILVSALETTVRGPNPYEDILSNWARFRTALKTAALDQPCFEDLGVSLALQKSYSRDAPIQINISGSLDRIPSIPELERWVEGFIEAWKKVILNEHLPTYKGKLNLSLKVGRTTIAASEEL